jgi:uncharacterized protein (TIGR03032 family)
MRLDTEFIRLPLRFDVERLSEEVLAVPEDRWRPHPQGHPGNSALPLIAVGGDPGDDSTVGAMAPTPHLADCEYLQQVLASFGTVLGRSRLMRLDGNAEATPHVDIDYYWAERVRVHVPVVTSPAVEFLCGERALHMPAGETWIFDAWRPHNVLNPTGDRRIHLVADTVGSSRFWDLVARGHRPFAPARRDPEEPLLVPFEPDAAPGLEFEQRNSSPVMSPWELERLAGEMVLADLDGGAEGQRLRAATLAFLRDWRAVWARFGPAPEGLETYGRLLSAFERGIAVAEGRVRLANGTDAVEIARQMLIRPALNPQLMHVRAPARRPAAPRFERPIFIVAPPRSGTSLLFETLARSPDVWTIGTESHAVIEGIGALHPGTRGWDSNRLRATDAPPPLVEALAARFLAELRDRDGRPPDPGASGLRLLEKTPKNSLRVPFLSAAFPEALFIYVHREPEETLASMIEAWESGRFVTYPDLPDWDGPPWSLVLTPEWRKLSGAPLAEIVAEQWRMASEICLHDLGKLPAERWAVVGYRNLVTDPQREVERLCEFVGIDWDAELPEPLPLSRHTLSPPREEKWRERKHAVDPVLPRVAEVARRGRELLARPLAPAPRVAGDAESPYRSVTGGGLGRILEQLGSTLLVSTYQTGKLVAVRSLDGRVNTHFRTLERPMGVAYDDGRLAVGTRSGVLEYRNLPPLAAKLEPAGVHDACFVPRALHYTGDIRIHDTAWAGGELWMVATRFSCLASLDAEHSFVPRWRPPFVSALAAEDRCHLNGMAVVDDEVRYVTALGESDAPGGWREHKASGGVLIDVRSGETVAAGLSMPHSPRWHRDRLWLLESGQGTLATVDVSSGAVETVAELPGFTRGLALAGPLAFVGLSEVREATTFGGLPLTGRLEERQCGVWVVNVETGKTVALLRFEDLVEEIFEVCLLPGIAFPEIAEHGSDAVDSAFVVPDAALQ